MRSVIAIASVAFVSSSEVPLTSSEVASHNSTVSNCGAAAFAYCCHTGTPCNCNAGIVTPGQCGRDAYTYCCGTGTPCMCAVGDNLADTKEVAQVVVSNEPLLELPLSEVSTHNTEWNLYSASAISDMEQLVVGSNAQDVEDLLSVEVVDMPLTSSDAASQNNTVSNCGVEAFAYCCHTGTPCNCNAGIVTPGQCGRDAYNYCCGTGIPCMCAVGDNFLTV